MTHAATLRLGELLIRAGLLEGRTLDEALRRQAQSGARLGETLVGMGVLEREELPALLRVQQALREGAEKQGLREGAARQALGERLRLGRLLLDAGEIDAATPERALERQRRLAAVALAGLAFLAALPAPAHAESQARLDIVATVLERAFVERQQLPQSVVISSQDVARGYVELDQPVEVGIRTNYRAGVLLGLSLNSRQVEAVDVQAAQGAELRAGGVYVPQQGPGLRPHTVWLKLRLRLAPGALPGIIAHPLTLNLSPA